MINWQQKYESNETPWDRGGPAPGLVEFLKNHTVRGRVLVPGCGFGSDVAPLAEAGADEVIGLDIAPRAVEAARIRLKSVKNAQFVSGDLFEILPGPWAATFDWVWEHTCYCAIDPSQRAAYAESIAAALRPGGYLLAVFFLNPWDPDEDQSQGPPFGTTVEDLDEKFCSRFDLLKSWRPESAYPGREGRELMRLLRKR